MLRAPIILIACLCGFFAGSATGADEEPFAEEAAETAKFLKTALGADWVVTVTGATINIESTFEIFRVAMMSGPRLPPPIDAARKALLEETKPETYVIRLRFQKKIDEAEFLDRRAERQKHADVLNFGAASKMAWSDSAKAYAKIQVPQYRWDFFGIDIYRDLVSESPFVAIYPLGSVAKIGAAKELIDRKFTRLRTGND